MTAPNATPGRFWTNPTAVADIAVKFALVGLILFAVINPDLGGVKAKAGGSRAIVYPLAMLIVPAIWWLFYRARAFPWLGDLLLCLPWFTDVLGNRLNLYDTVGSFDDWMHLINWFFLTGGFLAIALPRGASWWHAVERGMAFALSTAVLWEIAEYLTFIRFSPELETAYTDTLCDLVLDSLGALLAIALMWFTRSRRAGLRS